MNRKIFILLTVIAGALGAYAVTPGDLQPVIMDENSIMRTNDSNSNSVFDKNRIYYPNANISSIINKYKNGNYTGCLQELFSLTKKDPSNSLAYYYMGMAYSHLNMTNEAVEAYEKAIALNPNSYIAEYATKGKDCLTGGPACHPVEEQEAEQQSQDNLDKFINSPYGNGLSPELNQEIKQKQLNNIQQTINKKKNLDYKDIQKIRDFDTKQDSSSYNEESDKIAMVSDEEVLNAINTLKNAGVNLSFQKESPYAQMMNYQDPQMAELSMLLGNNNNGNSMMNMVPMMMAQYQEGKNIDPRFMQAMLMNSMVTDLNFNNNNNRY